MKDVTVAHMLGQSKAREEFSKLIDWVYQPVAERLNRKAEQGQEGEPLEVSELEWRVIVAYHGKWCECDLENHPREGNKWLGRLLVIKE